MTRVMGRLAITRGLPRVIRSGKSKAFCSKAMAAWAHSRGAQLRLIELGKPNQNAYIESFSRRLLDEPQRALVSQPAACPNGDRKLAARIQRGATKERTGRLTLSASAKQLQ